MNKITRKVQLTPETALFEVDVRFFGERRGLFEKIARNALDLTACRVQRVTVLLDEGVERLKIFERLQRIHRDREMV